MLKMAFRGFQDELGLDRIANEAFGVGEGRVRWRTEVVGHDFNAIVVPDGYTAVVPDSGAVSGECDCGVRADSKGKRESQWGQGQYQSFRRSSCQW